MNVPFHINWDIQDTTCKPGMYSPGVMYTTPIEIRPLRLS